MSRGARKTGGFCRRGAQRALRRKPGERREKTTILIVGEGQETEPNYFNGLKQEDDVRARFAVRVKKGPGLSPEAVVEQAIHEMEIACNRGVDFDEIWCVVDADGLDKLDSLRHARDLARQHGVKLCFSNPCFEVWLLSHFERCAASFADCDAVVARLDKHWQEVCKLGYQKNDERLYQRVADRTAIAIRNAKWVLKVHHKGKDIEDSNSATEVYLLVEHLVAPA